MFERYTEKARRVIFWGLSEARHLGSPAIETEHLLLGVAKEDPEMLASTVGHGATEAWLRERIPAAGPAHEVKAGEPSLPLSNASKRVLAYAAEEAHKLDHRHIGAEHLLLGLLREGACVAARLLKIQGADLKRVREAVAKRPVPQVHEGGPGSYSPEALKERQAREREAKQRHEQPEAREPEVRRVGFERYTEPARRAIFFARYEASVFGTDTIETEHLLLGVWRTSPTQMQEWTGSAETYEEMRAHVEERKPRKQAVPTSVDMLLSDEVKRVLEHAVIEEQRMGGGGVGNEHLLLGLMREERSLAAELLRERGADAESIRKRFRSGNS